MPPAKFSKGSPVQPEERAEIIRLFHEGKGRNEIARLTLRSLRTVSVICTEEGLHFDASLTEDATRHRTAQLAALRADTAMDLHLDAMRLTQQMWEPSTIYNFGGKDNTYEVRQVDEPPAIDKKNLMAAAGMALDRSLKLVPPTDDTGAGAAGSMLGQLMAGLKTAYNQAVTEEAAGEEAEGDAP